MNQILTTGRPATDFSVRVTPDQSLSLGELRRRRVALAFDWSTACGDQMTLYNQVLTVFPERGGGALEISLDGVWRRRADATHRNLAFPQLADLEPEGAVAPAFGACRDEEGVAERALFVISADGVIACLRGQAGRQRHPRGRGPADSRGHFP